MRRERPLSVSCSRSRRLLHLAAAGLLAGAGASLWGVPLPAQEPARGEPTAREIEELRAERDRLAREVEELRAKVAERQTGWSWWTHSPATAYSGTSRLWDVAPTEVEVQEGDTLEGILRQFFTEVDDTLIAVTRAMNPGIDEDRLQVGQKIKVPTTSTWWSSARPLWIFDSSGSLVHTVQKGDSFAGILREYHGSSSDELLERLRGLNPGIDPGRLRPGQKIRVPAPGRKPFAYTQNRTQWRGFYDPFLQDPGTGKPPPSPKTRAGDFDSGASRREAAALVQHPPGARSVLTYEPVLDLVTRAVELRGEVEIAVARLEEAGRHGEPTRIAEVEVRTAERKLEVVRRLVKGELRAADLELDLVRKQMRDLDGDDPRRMRLRIDEQRLELRLETLRSAL